MSRVAHALGGAVLIPTGTGPITAPDRLTLWRPGPIRGDFGECLWDDEAARQVMAEYRARGNPVPIDIEHNTNPSVNSGYDPNDPPEGGGYCWLEVDAEGALCLAPIRWSDFARREIETGSRCAISPDWDYDPVTKRPVRLKVVSLVQNPGTYGIGLIASARGAPACNARGTAMGVDLNMLMAMVAGLQALAETAAEESIKAQAAELAAALRKLAASLGLDLEATQAVEEQAEETTAGELEPAGYAESPATAAEPEELQKVMAMAASLLAGAKRSPRRGGPLSAPSTVPSLAKVKEVVQQELHQHTAKTQLIAAARNRPGMTPALAAHLMQEPIAKVKQFIACLPVAPAAATDTVGATAAADGPVRVGPLGTQPGAPLNTAERARIEAIRSAGATRKDIIERATAAAASAPAGAKTFSALTQMKR